MAVFFLEFLAFTLSLIGFRGIRVVAYVLGFITFDICRIRRKIILQNLDIVFGSKLSTKEKRIIGRKSVINFITTACEFLAAKRLLPKAKFEFKNKDIIDEINSRNQGMYAVCMHFGNWEYLCHINAQLFSPVYVVVKDVLSGKSEQWIKNLRKSLGYRLIDRNGKQSATHQIFRAIEHNEIVGFIVDQKHSRGELLPFFGKLAPTNNSLAKLYFRKPAPVTAATIQRIKPGHFQIEYSHEFIYEKNPKLSLAENITKFTQQVNEWIEPLILSKPDEYYWLHNRWNLEK